MYAIVQIPISDKPTLQWITNVNLKQFKCES
jgi:hypothetical protein